jgi:5-formyltetrahydrofolate cyclo-ligase
MDRQQIRQQKRQQRRELTEDERQVASKRLCDQIVRSPIFKNSKRIAFYLPNDGEIDLLPLLISAWRYNKHCFLPVLGPYQTHKLWFLPVTPQTTFVQNRFGILEPEHKKKQRCFKPISLNLILMPLVAFDIQGNRLGMGGGFYDRTLSFQLTRTTWNKPHLMGTAYAFQEISAIKKQKWDIPIHSIATDNKFFEIPHIKS